METWQNKIRHLRNFLRGWARNKSSIYKKEKEHLLQIIDLLDRKAETMPLNASEKEAMREANEKVLQLHRDGESKWAQWVKVKHVQEGGNNTKYFHLIANCKHRWKKNFQLEQDEGTIVGEENLESTFQNTIRSYLVHRKKNNFSLIESHIHEIPQISHEENLILAAEFTEKEIYDAIM
jgi:hypothetical protein